MLYPVSGEERPGSSSRPLRTPGIEHQSVEPENSDPLYKSTSGTNSNLSGYKC